MLEKIDFSPGKIKYIDYYENNDGNVYLKEDSLTSRISRRLFT